MHLYILYGALVFAAIGLALGLVLILLMKSREAPECPDADGPCLADGAENLPRENSGDSPAPDPSTVVVKCVGGERAGRKYNYDGLPDCESALRLAGGPIMCEYGCVGLGSCVKVCPTGALSVSGGVASINQRLCTSCLACVGACPRNLIVTLPADAQTMVVCASRCDLSNRRDLCNIGCLACGECESVCKNKAIRVVDGLARIDYESCLSCGDCAEKCPRKLIVDARIFSQYQKLPKN